MDKIIQFATKASFFDGPFGGGAPWIAAGMGYVILAGALTVIDGGAPEDAEALLALLERESGGTAKVDTWILTHPHVDHYGALCGICGDEALSQRLTVDRIVCLFDESLLPEEERHFALDGKAALDIALSATGAAHLVPEENMTLTCGETSIKVLYVPTHEDQPRGPNDMSLILKVKTPSLEAVFTGDAKRDSLEKTLERHRHELKSDAVQLPHHGLCDSGHEGFYEAVGAKIVMIPACVSGEARMTDGTHGITPAHYAKAIAERVYYAYNGNTEIK